MDFFHRQRAVPGWDDGVIAQQVALVLGSGGIGCSILMCLGRLGVREIILMDRDTVDATNLNRQLLFSVSDVGRRKVDAAADCLKASHAGMRTIVTPVHVDVIREWSAVVLPCLVRASVVFNAIDWGGSFDAVISAQCLAHRIPYVSASSYAHTAIAEGYAYDQYSRSDAEHKSERASEAASATTYNTPAGGCAACSMETLPPTAARLYQSECTTAAADLRYLPRDSVPSTGSIGSSVLPCTMAAEMAVNLWLNGHFGGKDSVPNQCIMNLASMDLASFRTAPEPNCYACDASSFYLSLANIAALAYGAEPVLLQPAAGSMFGFACMPQSAEPETEAHNCPPVPSSSSHAAASGGKCMPPPADSPDGRADATGNRVPLLPRLAAIVGDVYEPCIPAVDIDFDMFLHPLDSAARSTHIAATGTQCTERCARGVGAKLPSLLAQPLLKCAEGTIHGVRSGTRSAIIFQGNAAAFRLKGCNCFILMDETQHVPHPGFPLAPIEHHEGGGRQVRGCQFSHTAAREQVYSHIIGAALAQGGLLVGNQPLGVARYDLPEALDEVPQIGKYCGIFRTLGDKRLQSHVITGLERLLPYITQLTATEGTCALHDTVLSWFEPSRIHTTSTPTGLSVKTVIPTYRACLTGARPSEPVDARPRTFLESADGLGAASHTLCPPFWHPLWKCTCEELAVLLQNRVSLSLPAVLPYVYGRLGREVGAVQGILHKLGVSWGYFYDHVAFEPHNNGHPNNFVVIANALSAGSVGGQGVSTSGVAHSSTGVRSSTCSKSDTGGGGILKIGDAVPQYLAPVDFDMSFGVTEFRSNFTGLPDLEQFEEYRRCEVLEMQRVLGGDEQSNTGISLMAAGTNNAETAHSPDVDAPLALCALDSLRYALRDTLLVGWREGWAVASSWTANTSAGTGAGSASLGRGESGNSVLPTGIEMLLPMTLEPLGSCEPVVSVPGLDSGMHQRACLLGVVGDVDLERAMQLLLRLALMTTEGINS